MLAALDQPRSSQLIRIYQHAKDLANAGRTQDAIQLLSDNIVYDDHVLQGQQTLSETNGRLLSLLAGLLHKPRASEEQLFQAESYAAWAIDGSPCEGSYWKQYVDIRLDRETYAPMIGALMRREGTKYPLKPYVANLSGAHPAVNSQWTIEFPRGGQAQLLEGLTYLHLGEVDRAIPVLNENKAKVNVCPIGEILAEVDLIRGKPKEAISQIEDEFKDAGFGISAYRLVLFGQAQRATGDLEGAQRSFTEALRIDDSVYDAESALHAMASGESGDPVLLENYLKNNPEDWHAWTRLWGTGGPSAQTGEAEFARFAESKEISGAHAAPELAQGLVSLHYHDIPAALEHAKVAFQRKVSSDAALAILVLRLLNRDYEGAATAFKTLAAIDSKTALKLKQLGCNESSLLEMENGRVGPSAAQTETGKLLLRMAQKFPDNAYSQTTFGIFASELPQPTSGGILMSLLTDNAIVQGQSAEKLHQAYLQDYAELRSGLSIEQAQTRELGIELTEMDRKVKASEQRLVALMDKRDQRLTADLDRLAGLVSELRETTQGQQLAIDSLEGWRSGSSHDTAVKLSGIFGALSNAASVDASLSRVEFNMIGVLADILMLAGA